MFLYKWALVSHVKNTEEHAASVILPFPATDSAAAPQVVSLWVVVNRRVASILFRFLNTLVAI